MRAAYYEKQGAAHDVLVVGELPDPVPGPGEVRVRIAASAVNPSDTKGRAGFGSRQMGFPRIVPHQDGAGAIDAVGPGVSAARVGERVWVFEATLGRATGTAAELTVVPAHKAIPLPDDISFEIGACLGIPAMTAHRCLFADGPVLGRHVLVQGGAGAVGQAAILLARWAGAHVIATTSRPEAAAIARDSGAEMIDRKTEDVAARVRALTGGKGVERIVDVNLCANVAVDMACLADNGVVTAYASDTADAELRLPFLAAMVHGFVFRTVLVYAMGERAHEDAVRDVTACLRTGAYRPQIGLRLPLDRVADAHVAQDDGSVTGKILLTP